MKLSVSGELAAAHALKACSPQTSLYSEALFGDGDGASKLVLELLTLFPVCLRREALELWRVDLDSCDRASADDNEADNEFECGWQVAVKLG